MGAEVRPVVWDNPRTNEEITTVNVAIKNAYKVESRSRNKAL